LDEYFVLEIAIVMRLVWEMEAQDETKIEPEIEPVPEPSVPFEYSTH
jgi:hypothetical protein